MKEKRATSYLPHSHRLHCIIRPSVTYARPLLAPASARAPVPSAYARASSAAARRVRTSSTSHAAPLAPGEGERYCIDHTRAKRLVGGQEGLHLRLPSSLRPGVELARVQLTAARAEPAVRLPVRHGLAELPRTQLTTTGMELHRLTRLHSPKQQEDVALKPHVASTYFKCVKYFS